MINIANLTSCNTNFLEHIRIGESRILGDKKGKGTLEVIYHFQMIGFTSKRAPTGS